MQWSLLGWAAVAEPSLLLAMHQEAEAQPAAMETEEEAAGDEEEAVTAEGAEEEPGGAELLQLEEVFANVAAELWPPYNTKTFDELSGILRQLCAAPSGRNHAHLVQVVEKRLKQQGVSCDDKSLVYTHLLRLLGMEPHQVRAEPANRLDKGRIRILFSCNINGEKRSFSSFKNFLEAGAAEVLLAPSSAGAEQQQQQPVAAEGEEPQADETAQAAQAAQQPSSCLEAGRSYRASREALHSCFRDRLEPAVAACDRLQTTEFKDLVSPGLQRLKGIPRPLNKEQLVAVIGEQNLGKSLLLDTLFGILPAHAGGLRQDERS